MSFWLEDDENDNPWQHQKQIGQDVNAALASQKSTHASQSDTLFQCINCGSNESYYDDATGTDVCTSCFTQSQTAVNASQAAETDWEDVVGLAARTAGGQMIQQKFRNGTRQYGRAKQPLEELDQTVPLPDTIACLKGMQCIFEKCATIAVMEILPKHFHAFNSHPRKSSVPVEANDDSDDSMDHKRQRESFSSVQRKERTNHFLRTKLKSVLTTIKELWLSYLQAWAAGAEFYGPMYPHIRFSFRDHFLSTIHVSQIVRRYLPYQAKMDLQNGAGINAAVTPDIPISSGTMDDHDVETDEDESVTETGNFIGSTAIRIMIRNHNAHKPKGHMEAALFIRPSMTMVAAILWLALTKNRDDVMDAAITFVDVCGWIATGKLPLLSAYQNLLSKPLQKQLQPIAAFFQLDHPIHPHQLEAMANNLCVACRLLKQPIISDRHQRHGKADPFTVEPAVVVKPGKLEDVRYWSVPKLPIIIARLVAQAGLDQGVLDRALQLAGFPREPKVPLNVKETHTDSVVATPDVSERIPMIVPAQGLSRMEELLALIAIACQLDPQWRTWTYCLPKQEDPLSSTIIPWNESEFRMLTNGPSFRNYLDFMNEHFFSKSDTDEKESLLPQQYFDAAKSIERMQQSRSNISTRRKDQNDTETFVRPCRILAGANVPLEKEMTEWTFQRPFNGLSVYPQNRYIHKRDPSVQSNDPPAKTTNAATASGKKRIHPRKRLNKDLDEMILLPFHDFRQADRAMNDWVPTHPTAAVDLEEQRLIQYLAYTFHIDPFRIQQAMQRLLEPPKK